MCKENAIEIEIDLSLYDKAAALKTCYLFQDRFHASLETGAGSTIVARLIPKCEGIDLADVESIFKDEIVDQQVRLENEKLFSDIRILIVEQAFKPISYPKLKAKIKE